MRNVANRPPMRNIAAIPAKRLRDTGVRRLPPMRNIAQMAPIRSVAYSRGVVQEEVLVETRALFPTPKRGPRAAKPHWWSSWLHGCRASSAPVNRGVNRARKRPSRNNWVAGPFPSTIVRGTSRDATVGKPAKWCLHLRYTQPRAACNGPCADLGRRDFRAGAKDAVA